MQTVLWMNINRHRLTALLTMVVWAVLFAIPLLYFANITANQNQLNKLSESIPVESFICNLNGSQNSGLQIKETMLQQLTAQRNIKDLIFTVNMTFEYVDAQGNIDYELNALGLNNSSSMSETAYDNITFQESDGIEFLQSNEKQCLADEEFLHRHRLNVGETSNISLYYTDFSKGPRIPQLLPLGSFPLKIIGSYRGAEGTDETEQVNTPDMIFPIAWAEDAYRSVGVDFYADSASFKIKDPLKLNDFKAEMRELGLLPVIPNAEFDVKGNALIVKDGVFIHAAESTRKNLMILQNFVGAVFVSIVLLAYMISFLLLQNRRREFAIMRSLGMGNFVCMAVAFLENTILAIVGGAVALCVLSVLQWLGHIDWIIAIAAVSCFLLGSVFAIWRLNRVNVLSMLARD